MAYDLRDDLATRLELDDLRAAAAAHTGISTRTALLGWAFGQALGLHARMVEVPVWWIIAVSVWTFFFFVSIFVGGRMWAVGVTPTETLLVEGRNRGRWRFKPRAVLSRVDGHERLAAPPRLGTVRPTFPVQAVKMRSSEARRLLRAIGGEPLAQPEPGRRAAPSETEPALTPAPQERRGVIPPAPEPFAAPPPPPPAPAGWQIADLRGPAFGDRPLTPLPTSVAPQESGDSLPPYLQAALAERRGGVQPPGGSSPPPPTPGPAADNLVDAITCRNGHVNNPIARYCMFDGLALSDKTRLVRRLPRPFFALLQVDGGGSFALDRDAVIGLEPDTDPATRKGEAIPIVLPEPAGGIDPRHARIVMSGWEVAVHDLGSRLGTFVRAPDETEWAAVPANEPTPLVAGSSIRIGDHVLRFERQDLRQ